MTSYDISKSLSARGRHEPARGDETNTPATRVGASKFVRSPDSQAK